MLQLRVGMTLYFRVMPSMNGWKGRMKIIGQNYFPLLGALLKENGYLLLLEPAEGDVCRYLHGASAKAVMQNKRLYIQAPYFLMEWLVRFGRMEANISVMKYGTVPPDHGRTN